MDRELNEVDGDLIQGNLLDEDEPWDQALPNPALGARLRTAPQLNYNNNRGGDAIKNIGDYNSNLDVRKFSKDVFSLATSKFAVDKTIKRTTKVVTTFAARSEAIEVQSGTNGESLMQSISRSISQYDPNFRLEPYTKSISRTEKFKLQTWKSFNKYSIKFKDEGEQFDGCSQGISIDHVISALWMITDYYSKDELRQFLKDRHFEAKSVLSWTDFNDLVADVFNPFIQLLENKRVDYIAGESSKRAGSTLDGSRLPYQRMVDKSRLSSAKSVEGFTSASHLDKSAMNDDDHNKNDNNYHNYHNYHYDQSARGNDSLKGNNETSRPSTVHNVINTNTMQIGDVLAPKSILSQQILSVVRKKNRIGDKNYEKKLVVPEREVWWGNVGEQASRGKKRSPNSSINGSDSISNVTDSRSGVHSAKGSLRSMSSQQLKVSARYDFASIDSNNNNNNNNDDDDDGDVNIITFNDSSTDVLQTYNNNAGKNLNPSTSLGSKKERPETSKPATYMNETQKIKVNDLIDKDHAYPELWQKMQEKRNQERVVHDMVKISRNEMIGALNRVIYIDEKDKFKTTVDDLKRQQMLAKRAQAEKNQEKEDIMKVNWEDHKRKERINKSKYKQNLDASLKRGVEMAREQVEAERAEQVFMRDYSISRLDATSSSVVHVPPKLKEQVKNAKSYKEFTEGKAAIKKYYEDTMDSRIETRLQCRNKAINNSTNKDIYPVVISPMKGTQYFSEGGSVLSLDISSAKSIAVKDYRPKSSPVQSTKLPARPSSVKKQTNNKRFGSGQLAGVSGGSYSGYGGYSGFGGGYEDDKTKVDLNTYESFNLSINDSLSEQDLIINEYVEGFTAS